MGLETGYEYEVGFVLVTGIGCGRDLRRCVGEEGERERTGEELALQFDGGWYWEAEEGEWAGEVEGEAW